MAKAIFSGKKKPDQEDQQKTRKKQAKKEARLMLQVEQAKKDVHKAEQKANKAHTNLQEQQARLQKFVKELNHFRNASQDATAEVHSGAEPATGTSQSITPDNLQTSSSLPAEGTSNIGTPEASNNEVNALAEADNADVQPSSPPPAEGRSAILQEDETEAPVGTTNTPIENISTEQSDRSDETAGAQVHADISINPAPTEEDLTISSGDGSIPVVTNDESAWPPPQIREEIAESIVEEVAHEPTTATYTEQNEEISPEQIATGNGHGEAEENLVIASGDGSIPIITNDENAWPPPQIREEIAESVAEEVAQEHAAGNSEHGEANESDAEEETENHEAEHEASPSHPRRSPRRRTRSSTQQNTHKADQE